MRFLLPLMFCLLLSLLSCGGAPAARTMILRGVFPDSSERFYTALMNGLAKAGVPVDEVHGLDLASVLEKETGPGSVLVMPNARCFPADAKQALLAFLKRGNHMVAISGPAFSEMVCPEGGKWLTREATKAVLVKEEGREIIDFGKQDIKTWTRSSGAMSNPALYTTEHSDNPQIGVALHGKISKLDNWDTLVSKPTPGLYPEGCDTTVLWARGGPGTPEMVLEVREKDGSRWMGIVKLTTEWKRYALTPLDFSYWPDSASQGRGGPGDQLKPANIEVISIGLANGISSQEPGKPYEFWVANIRGVEDRFGKMDFAPPVLESLSPSYKTYRIRSGSPPGGYDATCPIPRAPGYTSARLSAYRYKPEVARVDETNVLRGSIAHLLINGQTDYPGSVWGFVGFDQRTLDQWPHLGVTQVALMLEEIQRGLFFTNAGTDRAAYAEGEPIKLGAYVLNVSAAPAAVEIGYEITKMGVVVHESSRKAEVAPSVGGGAEALAGDEVTLPPGEYEVHVTLSTGGQVADRMGYPFRVIRFSELTGTDVVTVKDGDFRLGGEKWYGVGMNYWPTYTCGREKWPHWMEPEEYNPEIVERDLTLAAQLGVNLLSIQYTGKSQAPAMMDFLARAHKRGIKVNVYMPGLDPLNRNDELARSLIVPAHLAESPAFFAYDLGWEVHVGRYDDRKRYDGEWQAWVIDRYGSVELAESDWSYKPDRPHGKLTGPSDEQLTKDGPWRIYVAAYRRFWDDEISKRYREVRAAIKQLDPHHLIGARSGYGGTGSTWVVPFFPFDLASGAKHLDFTSPEGYMLSGDRLGFLRGGLVTLYGQYVSGGKPVFWCEYGTSIWPQCDASTMERQRQYYERTLDMVCRSGAKASAGWWWPGGFRLGENSDFGIVSPDGAPRPAALELKAHSKRIGSPPPASKAEQVITIDRDSYVTGFAGVYEAFAGEYVTAIEAGRSPRIRTAGTGTTSADTPMVAVGNVPCNGHNPPKYLNAEINWLKINGQEVRSGDSVEVEAGKPVYVEASIGNTGEAKWLSPRRTTTGAVYLVAESARHGKAMCPIAADTPFLADATVTRHLIADRVDGEAAFTFRMTARDRTDFGEVVRVTVKPKVL